MSGAAAQRPTTPNHYSLGRHYGQQQQQHSTGSTTSITTGVGGSVGGVSVGPPTSHGGYPGAVSGFSSSSLSSVVAGSTLGPAGAGSIGTGHSSLAGYNNNVGGSALSGSALNLHSSSSSSSNAASLSTNGALAARGMKAIPPSSPARHWILQLVILASLLLLLFLSTLPYLISGNPRGKLEKWEKDWNVTMMMDDFQMIWLEDKHTTQIKGPSSSSSRCPFVGILPSVLFLENVGHLRRSNFPLFTWIKFKERWKKRIKRRRRKKRIKVERLWI